MGTTIRREPITTSIPAAPDYKFLNITNFGGIEKSSNPFVVSSNTASDCLNVYVDEDNALSTRPRLQHQTNFVKDIMEKFPITENFEIIGVYDLHDGYLVHGVEADEYYMFKYDVDKIEKISGTIPQNKCVLFEHNGDIYLLDGAKYLSISANICQEVTGYIPTVKVGKNKRTVDYLSDGSEIVKYDTVGSDFESLNLLTDRYKESYFWDGISEFTLDSNVVHVDNEYYETLKNLPQYDIIKYYPDDTFLFKKVDGARTQLMYGILSEDKETYTEVDVGVDITPVVINDTQYTILVGTPTDSNVKMFGVVIPKANNTIDVGQNGTLKIYKIMGSSGEFEVVGSYDNLNNTGVVVNPEGLKVNLSENGIYSWVTPTGYFKYENTLTLNYTAVNNTSESFVPYRLHLSDVANVGYYMDNDSVSREARLFYIDDLTNIQFTTYTSYNNMQDRLSSFVFIPKGAGYVVPVNGGFWVMYRNSHGSFDFSEVSTNATGVYFDPDLRFAILSNSSGYLYFASDYTNLNNYYKTIIPIDGSLVYFEPAGHIVTLSYSRWTVRSFVDSTEPLIVLTYKIKETDDVFNEFNSLRRKVNTSKIIVRFDNNVWFASGNNIFHTEYNNPKYIPMTSYNDLGESADSITGLSIVNDNILAAYKRNRIYIITPITVGNELTYSYTETKNVIGNDVINAPILTILTEMPVIVSYNGIYALNQLENVQSSDRITALISETMNPKWLKERKEDVDRCITLNRLYWTYFILPHKKVSNGIEKDNDYTKIYLLDNRTGMWFYWELPIYVISAMIKDNKTHFVTSSGELYSLETTDIINKFNKDLTEYYDDLKKPSLIPWYWTSQILSLNTINYSKRLVDTTFVLTDTDSSDSYALNYKFKAFRKNKNAETTELTLTNDIEYVESITKRTMIPRFNFLQFTLSNTEDDEKLNNNKLRLVGLGLKYVLLGGLY